MSHSLPLTNNEPPLFHEAFTSLGADINLTTRSAKPPHAAQRLLVQNDETTFQQIVLKDLNGVSASYPVPPDTVLRLDGAYTAIVASGTGTIAKVVAQWWLGPGYRLNA